ncbi:hypothetical protein DTO006G1_7634 [Penicillium roqueforti]|uniref:uncharacterized protein n=1 Tax=Penicillium roqueforti TaxID=5082 RepID=UPI00190CC495|nr:uncharacterized protein LCP9604111_7094 [Penicillium roqueforti]KAF9244702.1 hypothetical protein LCP9604111_7094 [Penicillium roqueforti]KAI1831278.1 hypothetical protein CBS147337_8036 [Penicillium roqueforti]KAI2681022.1 hypothetical protein LCP963914a_6973 [Penicillium roqueforti]KAI2689579.1 hypothetical protein CBS147355_30 [Penicillium roqueforti]KAI2698245.1 hypothetical protein CBS147372_7263 [Penicillium roqueforti]
MASNSTQNETPAWLNSVFPGAYGLIGLVVVVALVFWAIRFLALEARLSDPQRALTDHFIRQVAEIRKAKAASKMEEKKEKTEEKDERKKRWADWLLKPFGLLEISFSTNAMLRRLGSSSNRKTDHPVLYVIVEEFGASTAEAEAELEDVDCDGIVIRWVRVPRGYRLPPKSKKASTLAEVVGALQGRK